MLRTIRTLGVFVGLVLPGLAQTVTSGELFYTRYSGASSERVKKVAYSYDGAALSLATPVPLGVSLSGADGLVFAPDQDLIVGGQGLVYKVDLGTASVQSSIGPHPAVYHVMLDPSGTKVWGAGLPGALLEFPLAPFGSSTVHSITGSNNSVTQVVWAGAQAFYTASGPNGFGAFGTIDLSVTPFVTQSIHTSVPWAHGASFDPLTKHLFMFGGTHIAQIDPANPGVIHSELNVGSLVTSTLDQGSADGAGHLFVACNDGRLVFVDYSASLKVGDPSNLVSATMLDTYLDDVAPLSGLGSSCGTPASLATTGPGWPGTGGRIPQLSATTPPASASPFAFTLQGSNAGPSSGCVIVSTGPANFDRRLGGRVLVDPRQAVHVFPIDMLPGWPATITLSFDIPVLTAETCGMTWYLQAFVHDPGASHGVAFSRRLEAQLGE